MCLRSCRRCSQARTRRHRAAYAGNTRRGTAALSLPPRAINPSRRIGVAVAIDPSGQAKVFGRAGEAHRDGRSADNRDELAAARLVLNPGLVSAACSQPTPPAGQSPAEHSDRPTAADGRECDHDVPTRPDPLAVASSVAALGDPHSCLPTGAESSGHSALPARPPRPRWAQRRAPLRLVPDGRTALAFSPAALPRELAPRNITAQRVPHWGLPPDFEPAPLFHSRSLLRRLRRRSRSTTARFKSGDRRGPGGVSTASSVPATVLMLPSLCLHGAWPNSLPPPKCV